MSAPIPDGAAVADGLAALRQAERIASERNGALAVLTEAWLARQAELGPIADAVAPSAAELASAQNALAEAIAVQAAMGRQAVFLDPEQAHRLEEVHRQIEEVQARPHSRLTQLGARRQLSGLEQTERQMLEQLGFDSYLDYHLQRAMHRPVAGTGQRLVAANEAILAAKAALDTLEDNDTRARNRQAIETELEILHAQVDDLLGSKAGSDPRRWMQAGEWNTDLARATTELKGRAEEGRRAVRRRSGRRRRNLVGRRGRRVWSAGRLPPPAGRRGRGPALPGSSEPQLTAPPPRRPSPHGLPPKPNGPRLTRPSPSEPQLTAPPPPSEPPPSEPPPERAAADQAAAERAAAERAAAERAAADAARAAAEAARATAGRAAAAQAAAERAAVQRAAVERAAAEPVPGGPAPLKAGDLEVYLLARIAAQRAVNELGAVPLIVDNALSQVPDDVARTGLALLERMADAVQIVYFSDDPAVETWARRLRPGAAAVFDVTAPGGQAEETGEQPIDIRETTAPAPAPTANTSVRPHCARCRFPADGRCAHCGVAYCDDHLARGVGARGRTLCIECALIAAGAKLKQK